QSLCQAAVLNSIDDSCILAPPDGPTTIGETEHEAIAWCTKPRRGTRLIPGGVLKGVQFTRTPYYTLTSLKSGDWMDPRGADPRGSPIGGLVFSSSWSRDNKNDYKQLLRWVLFYFKVCGPASPNARYFCERVYNRIGCAYNAPNNAKNGTLESCQGANQDYPGIYTDYNGQIRTYNQPPSS
ncbi:hypothetical protein BDM02DRAFT_3067844, partial [Thelephora ganbajun]